MAFEKEWLDENTGKTYSYWAVYSARFDYLAKTVEKSYGVWHSKVQFDEGRQPVYTEVEISKLGENEKLEAEVEVHAETVVLAKEQFKGAKIITKVDPKEPIDGGKVEDAI